MTTSAGHANGAGQTTTIRLAVDLTYPTACAGQDEDAQLSLVAALPCLAGHL